LERWAATLVNLESDTYRGILDSVLKIFKMRAAERNPQDVDIKEGWSPYRAKDALVAYGFKTGYYHELQGEWFAYSPAIDVGGGIFPSNISYYVDGTEKTAKILKLKMNINNPETDGLAHALFLSAGKSLYEYATNMSPPLWLEEALLKGCPVDKVMDCFKISIKKDEFHNRSFGGYDVKFVISNYA
jgi:hypothetical protein